MPTFDKTCGGVLYDQAGWLSSPITDDGNYGNDENCWWFIVADLYQAITINITDIDIEDNIVCGYDYLRVRITRNYAMNQFNIYGLFVKVDNLLLLIFVYCVSALYKIHREY